MKTVLELALRSLYKRADEGMALSNINEGQLRQLARIIRKLKFYIKYRGPAKQKQMHEATGVSRESARGKRMDIKGENVSIADYFKRTYNITLRFPDAPLVKKRENLYPMELCFIAPVHPLRIPSNRSCNVTPKS